MNITSNKRLLIIFGVIIALFSFLAGGLFLWGTLPEELSAEALLKDAVEQKVAFVPGGSFHPRGGGENTMRLNFSNATPEMITEGIRRLGVLLQEKTKGLVKD